MPDPTITKLEGTLSYVDSKGNVTEMYPEIKTDEVMNTSGKAADAKAVGNKLKVVDDKLKVVDDKLKVVDDKLKNVQDAIEEVNGHLIASDNVPFRFGVNSKGEYGYIITNVEGADTVIPFSNEASYAAALYNALKPSGLVNANMTFNQLIAVVASQNPTTYSLIRSGWTVGSAGGAITSSVSSNNSEVTLRIASQTGMNAYAYYTSPAINLSSFKTLTLQGSSFKVTGNPYGSDDYRPKVKLLNASGAEVTTIYAHPNYDTGNTTYTINTSYDCSSLSGNYYLRLQLFSYSSTDSTNVGSYIKLTKALFST